MVGESQMGRREVGILVISQWRGYLYIPSVYNVKWTVNLCKQNFIQDISQQLYLFS